jgi:hypothetical protein
MRERRSTMDMRFVRFPAPRSCRKAWVIISKFMLECNLLILHVIFVLFVFWI